MPLGYLAAIRAGGRRLWPVRVLLQVTLHQSAEWLYGHRVSRFNGPRVVR